MITRTVKSSRVSITEHIGQVYRSKLLSHDGTTLFIAVPVWLEWHDIAVGGVHVGRMRALK